ncbi:NACHT domain-containing protein [Streptomyces crystallinus]|uniref:NACHT domain-containing protein n=1 Tax=Streptomyces crystallinus TaxID=68191 RepID=A0ABN1F8K0_9ACTN
MRYWRRGIWVGAVLATGAVVAVAVRERSLSGAGSLVTVLGFVFSLVGLVANTLRPQEGERSPAEHLEHAADALAEAVRLHWQTEWRLRRLQDPRPLPVRWTAADPWLADEPENIAGDARWDGARTARCDGVPDARFDGVLDDIARVFAQVPSRRLVVLGAPGSGKTVLAVRFALDLLEHRDAGDPVPVIFPLAGWQPDRTELHAWLAERLAQGYPALGAIQRSGVPLAAELLAAGRVLPVLDGLDELAAPLRAEALRRLNSGLDEGSPLLLTCRSRVYAQVVADGDVFTAAAVVELQPLAFEEAADFLRRTARPVRGPSGERATAWDPVLARTRPGDPVRQVLASPLMVAMARAVYGESGNDPGELLRRPEFADPTALEEYLLDAFVPASFAGSTRWDTARALRWLRFLARRLEHRDTRDLAWWELHTALPRPLPGLGPLLLLGLLAEAVCLPLWALGQDPALPAVTAATVAGACAGYAARGGPRRRFLLPLLYALPLSLAVGLTRPLSQDPYHAVPFAGMPRVLGWLAVGGLYGLVIATGLAAIGLPTSPLPSTMPFFGRRRRGACGRWSRRAGAGLLAAAGAVLVGAGFLPDSPLLTVLGAVVAGALTAYLVRGEPAVVARSERRDPVGRARRLGRAMAHGLAVGLLAGLSLGAVFTLAEGGAAAARAALREDFPVSGPVRHAPDGSRHVDAPDGTRYGLRAHGRPYLVLPQPVHGTLVERGGTTRFALPADVRDLALCAAPARCTAVDQRLSISAHDYRPDGEVFTVRLADGRDLGAYDLSPLLDRPQEEWLTRQSPGALLRTAVAFGLAGGLGLGLVAGIAAGLHRWLGAPVDVTRGLSPSASIATDRGTALARALFTYLAAVLAGSALPLLLGLPDAARIGAYALVPTGAVTVAMSAWGRLAVARLWLCACGALPWRLMAFLGEAHRLGVLRQAGAVYQFRHARLQERLASPPVCATRPRPAPPCVRRSSLP